MLPALSSTPPRLLRPFRMLALASLIIAAAQSVLPAQTSPPRTPSPTVLRLLNKMTPTQRAHSRLYEKFRTGFALIDERAIYVNSVHRGSPDPPTKTGEGVLRELACQADSWFTASVVAKSTHPIEDGSFLFTDYDAQVTAVFRQPNGAAIEGPITVTRPGGVLDVDGGVVQAIPPGYPLLDVGREYLFLATYLRETRTYKAHVYESTFLFSPDRQRWIGLDVSLLATGVSFGSTGLSRENMKAWLADTTCK